MTNLSPAAQAVLDAVYNAPDEGDTYRLSAAAALRAVADQVAPCETEIIDNCYYEARNPVREQLHAIADELKGP